VLMVQWVWFAEPLEIAEAIDTAWSRPRYGSAMVTRVASTERWL